MAEYKPPLPGVEATGAPDLDTATTTAHGTRGHRLPAGGGRPTAARFRDSGRLTHDAAGRQSVVIQRPRRRNACAGSSAVGGDRRERAPIHIRNWRDFQLDIAHLDAVHWGGLCDADPDSDDDRDRLEVAGDKRPVTEGDMSHLPSGTAHRLHNDTEAWTAVLVMAA